jgi:Ca-activated chloride channel family protein
MSGEKIQAAKESIKKVIDALQPDDDVSLIVFDDKLDVVFRHGDLSNRQKLKDLVDSVRPSGSTHLSGGLACGALSLGCKPFEVGFFQASAAPGFEFLADIPEKDFPNNSSKRIFLFSDGAANKGVTKQEELAQLASDICEAGAATSTFGIGRDFSEATMTAISRSGHGNFTYIKKAKLIDTYVTEAFSNLTRLIGTSGKLTLRGVGPCLVKKVWTWLETFLFLKKRAKKIDLRSSWRKCREHQRSSRTKQSAGRGKNVSDHFVFVMCIRLLWKLKLGQQIPM